MGIARNIARLIPNGSGLLPNANIEAVAATKLTGIVPDANAPSGSIITSSAYDFTTRATFTNSGTYTTYLSGSFTKSRSDTQLMIIVQLSVRSDYNGATSSRFNIGSSTVFGGGKFTTTVHIDLINQIFYVPSNTQTGSLSWSYEQDWATFNVLHPNSGDDARIANSTSRVMIFEVMP